MPRRKAAEIEILPTEDDQQPRGRKKLVEAEHTIKYSAPVPVTLADDPEEDPEESFDFVEEEKAKRRRKTTKDERDDLRRELDKLGVASVSRLKLSIDKYRHSDSDDSGTLAEKDYCTKYPVTKDHIISDEYMEVARRYGAGRFWFTLRMDNKIVRQWERQVNQAVTPSGPVIQHVNPNDPTSPQVIIQSTNGESQAQQAPMSIKDIMKTQREALKEQLEMAKLMREAYGFAPEPQQQQPKTEEEILASAILKQPDVIENVVGSVIKRFGGKAGAGDSDPWADVAMEAVKSGQAAQIVQVAIDRIFNGLSGLFPKGANNGTPPLAQTPQPPSNMLRSPGEGQQFHQTGENPNAQAITQGAPSASETGADGPRSVQEAPQQQMTPIDALIYSLIAAMERQAQITDAQNIINIAVVRNPELGDSIDEILNLDADQILAMLTAYYPQVAQMSHAREWLESLIAALTSESQEGEGQ